MLATWHFHIEISSMCTIKCPRCARQEVPDSLINTELDLEFFKRNFTPEFIVANVEKITLCEIGNKGLYIDARGRLFPCCWVANRYTHNSEWQTLAEQFNLHHRTLTDVVADPFWEGEFKAFKWQECTQKCNKNLVNQEYSTSW